MAVAADLCRTGEAKKITAQMPVAVTRVTFVLTISHQGAYNQTKICISPHSARYASCSVASRFIEHRSSATNSVNASWHVAHCWPIANCAQRARPAAESRDRVQPTLLGFCIELSKAPTSTLFPQSDCMHAETISRFYSYHKVFSSSA